MTEYRFLIELLKRFKRGLFLAGNLATIKAAQDFDNSLQTRRPYSSLDPGALVMVVISELLSPVQGVP